MKKSRYNRILESDGKKIAFNSITCSLAEVDDDFFRILDNLDNLDFDNLSEKDAELVEQMKEGNFIVEDCLDELKLVKFRNYSGKFSEGSFGFVLAPTLACNFACPYCYETARPGMMTKEVQDKLIERIEFGTVFSVLYIRCSVTCAESKDRSQNENDRYKSLHIDSFFRDALPL